MVEGFMEEGLYRVCPGAYVPASPFGRSEDGRRWHELSRCLGCLGDVLISNGLGATLIFVEECLHRH